MCVHFKGNYRCINIIQCSRHYAVWTQSMVCRGSVLILFCYNQRINFAQTTGIMSDAAVLLNRGKVETCSVVSELKWFGQVFRLSTGLQPHGTWPEYSQCLRCSFRIQAKYTNWSSSSSCVKRVDNNYPKIAASSKFDRTLSAQLTKRQ